jgi:HK97 family phage portal protein
MNFRSAITALFGGRKEKIGTAWREIGTYTSHFYPYSGDVYANDVARACVRTLAEHSSKANVVVRSDPALEKLLRIRPNMYMNGKDFLYKCRTLLEINNTCMIYINRDNRGRAVSLYPMPHCPAEAIESSGKLYIKFRLADGTQMTAAWEDLAVLRKDYNKSDIFGDANDAVTTSLQLLDTTAQGMANAIKSTANLRGILKSTKAMLSDEDVKRQKDRFVADYLNMENSSGIAMLDSTVDFRPIDLKPEIANYKSVEELRNNLYRYFGLNEDAVMGRLHGDTWEAFYENSIEPFLMALGLELTYKVYTDRQRGFGNEVIFESSRMQYMSMETKLQLVQYVDRGIMTPNEVREVLNLAPIDGGDAPIRRLDTAPTDQVAQSQQENEDEGDDADDQPGQAIPNV